MLSICIYFTNAHVMHTHMLIICIYYTYTYIHFLHILDLCRPVMAAQKGR